MEHLPFSLGGVDRMTEQLLPTQLNLSSKKNP
jgi:hypothetical protein